MSRRMVVECDKCRAGSADVQLVSVVLDGKGMEIDLCPACAATLRDQLKELFTGAVPAGTYSAVPVKRGPGRPKGSRNKPKGQSSEPVVKRGPGRPKGSRNKPKSVQITLNPTGSDESGTFVAKPRKIASGKSNAKAAAVKPAGVDVSQVRSWAREKGIPVPERGRLSADLISQYQAAIG